MSKVIRFVKKKTHMFNVYFGILSFLLIPAIFFVIKASDQPVWGIIPEKHIKIFLDGDFALGGICQSYICSYVFYLLVNYFPDRMREKREKENYLNAVQQYMFTMASAILGELNNPSSFYFKLYSVPIKPQNLCLKKEWREILKIFHENRIQIESNYNIYIALNGKEADPKYKLCIDEACKKLKQSEIEYRNAANKMNYQLGKWKIVDVKN